METGKSIWMPGIELIVRNHYSRSRYGRKRWKLRLKVKMISKHFRLYCLLFIFSLANLLPGILMGQAKSVSLTFDDLPATHGDLEDMQYVTSRLLQTLTENKIPAIGFVNEAKLYKGDEPDTRYVKLLSNWLEAGMELGNHTYSHVYINQASIDEYKEEVRKGEIITRPLVQKYGKKLKYFRHTQLRTGPTETYRQKLASFLKEEGYTVAPVTMDSDEYIYAYCYRVAKLRGDQNRVDMIRLAYLNYMEEIFKYFEDLSDDFLGYQPKQTLLLHANMLNADVLETLIKRIESRGYSFITLEDALTDPAYKLPEAQSTRGLSWLHRWMLAKDIEPSEQPEPTQEIMNLFNQYSNETR